MAEVGKLSIGIEGDTSKLEKDVAAAKQKIDSSGTADAGEKAAAKAAAARAKEVEQLGVVGAKLKDVKKTYGEQIEVVQGLVGKLFAVGAIAGTFYKIGEAISTQVVAGLETANDRATKFLLTLDVADRKGAVKGIANQIQELNTAIAKTYDFAGFSGAFSTIFGEGRSKLIAERKILEDQLKGLSNRASDEAKKKQEEAAEAKRKQDADTLDRMDEQGRAGRQRIDDEQQKRREQFEDFQAQMAEMDRKAAEAAKKVQESWSNAFRAIREENNRAFATDQAASMVQFAQQMKLDGMLATSNMNRIVVEGVG